VERHLCVEKRLHWQVDYLLHATGTRIVQVWVMEGAVRRECDWACAARQLPGAGMVVPRFGSSDCRCAAHLIGFAGPARPPSLHAFAVLVGDPVRQWMTR
jgi:Uri superfamily endonuclease